ncbi:gliding motility protein [Pedobacter yulinensis]|uniref:Gliding motility protein n=1 Tax=Pedobacter yulinensis TaxID=2126353 RepID=A0A2T3HM37_9SPHI|nr:outer membrane lipoprotein carrier protein LolA [Pedobacter yulinensis]PST83494.1 gliding motility protein [Pedobacter yulinensis]
MKKIILTLLIAAGVTGLQAQSDTKAKAILAEVSKKYRSYDVVKSDFTLTVSNAKTKAKQTQQGTLLVKANSNKYKVSMPGQELISDGKSQWTYLKDDKEVQVSDADNSSDALNPAKIFTIFERGFKPAYTGQKKLGTKVYELIDLVALDARKPFSKIKLTVDKAGKQISNVVLYDKNGNTYTYNVRSFTPNVKVPETAFAFDAKKHPGVEVVDLR